jgi:anti-sigma factor RsiW
MKGRQRWRESRAKLSDAYRGWAGHWKARVTNLWCGRGILVAGTPERGAVVQRARELVDFARSQGYRLDELVKIIEDVG